MQPTEVVFFHILWLITSKKRQVPGLASMNQPMHVISYRIVIRTPLMTSEANDFRPDQMDRPMPNQFFLSWELALSRPDSDLRNPDE